jgi:hypothetical protein
MGKRKIEEVIIMEDINEVLEEEGLDKAKLEAALELARLVADETGMCCERLGQFTWICYRKLEGD